MVAPWYEAGCHVTMSYGGWVYFSIVRGKDSPGRARRWWRRRRRSIRRRQRCRWPADGGAAAGTWTDDWWKEQPASLQTTRWVDCSAESSHRTRARREMYNTQLQLRALGFRWDGTRKCLVLSRVLFEALLRRTRRWVIYYTVLFLIPSLLVEVLVASWACRNLSRINSASPEDPCRSDTLDTTVQTGSTSTVGLRYVLLDLYSPRMKALRFICNR